MIQNKIYFNVCCQYGSDFEKTFYEARKIARRLNVFITYRYNGIDIYVEPLTTYSECWESYDLSFNALKLERDAETGS